MPRIDYLPRTGMYEEAAKFAFNNNAKLSFSLEEYLSIYKEWVYKSGEGHAKLRNMDEELNKWFNENYLLYCCDMTHPDDNGSREEVVLVVKKPEYNYDYGEDYMYYHPDLTKDVVAAFWR